MQKSIAVVDDESDLADLFSEALKISNYDVCSFTDPTLAYEHIKENPDKYSLLITDYRMPQMNGLLLATKLLEIDLSLKVIIMYSFQELEYIPQFRFIRKPISILKFVKIVNETILSPLSYGGN
ncbi:MAG: response regulator [Deltaproteobacteria bacterium]|jgi:DNA-binding NtrC family response regulator|nr:response regulator [Nitrososphaeraceae archaeon]